VNLDPFLLWIENTALSRWLVESPSLLAFPTVLILHAIGMGFAAGIAVAFDLRVLGVAPNVPFAAMRRLFTVLWAGFWLNAASGLLLLWESWLRHGVEPNRARTPRISVSFNYA